MKGSKTLSHELKGFKSKNQFEDQTRAMTQKFIYLRGPNKHNFKGMKIKKLKSKA
jgi:hypothetical protein